MSNKIVDRDKYLVHIGEIKNDLKSTLHEGLEFIDWGQYIDKGSTVFIKPNFSLPYYREGVTTNPELLKHLLELIKSRTDRVIVGESDGGNHSFTADTAFKHFGMHEICDPLGVKLVNLSTLPYEIIESEVLGKKVKVMLPRMLLEEINCFISLAVMKVHAMTGVSLSIKNLWGCWPDTMRGLHHQDISYRLALLTKLLNPRIAIIDARQGLSEHGPVYGDLIKMNLLITANNVVAADTMAVNLMRRQIEKINHIQITKATGIGTTNLEDIKTNTNWENYGETSSLRKLF